MKCSHFRMLRSSLQLQAQLDKQFGTVEYSEARQRKLFRNNAYINLLTFCYANWHTHNCNYALCASENKGKYFGPVEWVLSSRSTEVGVSRFCSRCILHKSLAGISIVFACIRMSICIYVCVCVCVWECVCECNHVCNHSYVYWQIEGLSNAF